MKGFQKIELTISCRISSIIHQVILKYYLGSHKSVGAEARQFRSSNPWLKCGKLMEPKEPLNQTLDTFHEL